MKKLYILTLFITFFASHLLAQKMEWVKSVGSRYVANDVANEITYDQYGSSFTVGYFYYEMDADPGPGISTLTGAGRSAFLIKLDSNGKFVWAKAFGGSISGGLCITEDITLDTTTGDIYLTGSFTGTVDFKPDAGVYNLIAPLAISNAFIVKLDAVGNLNWATQLGNNLSNTFGASVTFDNAGEIIFAGKFSGEIDFAPGISEYILNAPSESAYFAKYKKNGNLNWVKQLSGTGTSNINTVVVDNANQIIVTGTFQGYMDFNPDAPVSAHTALGGDDIFVAKYTSAGALIWANQLGSTMNEASFSVATDQADNIYCSGYFYNTVDFDAGAGYYPLTAGIVGSNFLLKLKQTGGFGWAKKFPKKSFTGSYVTTDAESNIYTAGDFDATTDFNFGTGVDTLALKGSGRNAYIAKYDSAANFIWAKNFGGTGATGCKSITVNQPGYIFIAGQFSLDVDFNPGPDSIIISSSYGEDAFMYKMNQCVLTLKKTISLSGSVLTSDETGASYQWFDCATGINIPGATSASYFVIKSGNYGVKVVKGHCKETSDCMKVTATGIDEFSRNNLFSCYPNPTNGTLNIQLNKSYSNPDIYIRNLLGQTVYNSNFNAQQNIAINFDAPAGIYFVEIQTEEGKLGQAKILKQ